MKLINKFNRRKLGEGRNYQLGFTFCKKISKGIFETVQAPSACKDYLNDVVYAEATGKSCSAYGCHATKLGIFKGCGYLAIKICKYNGGGKYPNYDKDKQNLNNNILNMLIFIRRFEKLLGIKTPSKLKKVEVFEDVDKNTEEVFIFKCDLAWVQGTYAISLYALLLRLSQWYDGKQDVIEYLSKFNHFAEDVYLVQDVLPKIKILLKTGLQPQDLTKVKAGYEVHNLGIQTYSGIK